MLPTFQVRGLRCCSSDSISGAEDGWADIQLDNELQYEQLIREHPETTLSYVDDDDGEIITVGSSEELIGRVDELQPLSPVIFDLLVSPSDPKYESAIKLWRKIIESDADALKKDKGKGKAKEDIVNTADSGSSTVSRSGILVDPGEDGSTSSKEPEIKEDPAEQPLLSMFESEIEKILQATANGTSPQDETPATPERSPSPITSIPQPYPSEILGQTLRTIAQNVGRVANELRNDLPSHAQPTVEALNIALHSAIGTFTAQLQAVALDAAAAARSAAQATREMDVSELEATGRRMKELAETVGHIAVQGAGVAKEEVDRALGHVSGAGRDSSETVQERAEPLEVQEVQDEKEVAQSDLAKAESALKEAQKSVSSIKRQHLVEIRSLSAPPSSVFLTMESVCTLLGHKVDGWADIQTIIRQDNFISSIIEFDNEKQMTRSLRHLMKEYLSNPAYNYTTMNRASRACGPLVQWVKAQVDYSEAIAHSKELPKQNSKEVGDAGSGRNERAPINIADAVNIPTSTADPKPHPNAFVDSSSEDDGLSGSRNGRDAAGRRRRHCDPLRGHDGPARSTTFPNWAPGHHMFHPKHPRHGRHGPHHGGPHHGGPHHGGPHHGPPPPHHPHFGMPGSHPHHPPPPPPPPHHPHDPAPPPPPPPPPPPSHDSHSSHRHSYPPPPPPPPPPFSPHHAFRLPPPFWGMNVQSAKPQNRLVINENDSLNLGAATEKSEGDQQRKDDNTRAPPPLFPFIRRANTIGSDSREQWVVPHPSEREQGNRFIPPVAAMSSIPSAQHVMRRFPSLSSFHSSSGPAAGGLRAQASVPNFRSEKREASTGFGQNPFATPPRQPSPISEQTPATDARRPGNSESRALPGEWPQAVLIPPPPPPAPMDAFTPRGLHRANSMGVFGTRVAKGSLFDTLQGTETNPFVERRKRRENRMDKENKEKNDWDYYSRRAVPGSFPLAEQTNKEEQPQKSAGAGNNNVDQCVAQLLEMGYAEDESESALERLRVYSQITEGKVEDAVELLEEERKAWVQRNE